MMMVTESEARMYPTSTTRLVTDVLENRIDRIHHHRDAYVSEPYLIESDARLARSHRRLVRRLRRQA
jgi:hypothetical protein